MASPTPESPKVLDSKPRDSVSDNEQKSGVNGHVSSTDSKAESEALAASEAKTEPSSASNGVDKKEDVKMENGDDDEKKPSADLPAKDEDSSAAMKQEVEPEAKTDMDAASKVETAKESKPKPDEPAPVPADDVDMADAGEKPAEREASAEPTKAEGESKDAPIENDDKKDEEMAEAPSEELPTVGKINGATEPPTSSGEEAPFPGSEVDLGPESLSQLAIETTEVGTLPPKPSVEASMDEVIDSVPSGKVAREREDDGDEEPAPKRAKTEPKEDDPAAPTPEPSAASAPADVPGREEKELSPLKRLTNWNDATTNAMPLTQYQRREIRKVLGRIKKTKSGGHFRDSVQKLWPVLWDSYVAKIEHPTDLSVIDRALRDPNGAYATLGDFKKDLALMYDNTRAFNGPLHEVTHAAQNAIRAIWDDVLLIPSEEPTRPKATQKPKPPREVRTANHVDPVPRKPSTAPASPAVDVSDAKSHASVYENTSDLRRASTATDGDRPKRTVRAPKPKDIDYTTKPSRKKLKPELQFCEEVLLELTSPKNRFMNTWFLEAVDAEGLNVPQYYSIIKKPMDFGKVSRMLASGDIASLKDFDKSVKLIFTNCYTFNGTPDQGNAVSLAAKDLETAYHAQMKKKDAWLARHAKTVAPPAASGASDDEDEEDEEFDNEEAAASGSDPAKEVRELEAKFREETGKLTVLFEADTPNQAMITVQQGILKMVQEALLEAKKRANDYRQKHDKSGKKASKPNKSKLSSGSVARKPSGSASQPKKSGSKKAAPKRTLTAADKDQIANAINDLEYPHLDRAIDIIKRDTGQAENNDGELELDIDQLSNEALLRLWELCKKVLPGFGKDSAAPAPVSSPEMTRAAPSKKAPSTATKPKKNKPMSAREQEERIAQLRGLRDLYKPGQEPGDATQVTQAPTPTAESSDDSDSEEE